MIASAQISVYPLRQNHLGPAIAMVRESLAQAGLAPVVGAMSTVVTGEDRAIFAALADAFARAAEFGPVVLTITVSNACPVST
jgi:uncharacterized protein YqgV (UPF0045/DUF77 family)